MSVPDGGGDHGEDTRACYLESGRPPRSHFHSLSPSPFAYMHLRRERLEKRDRSNRKFATTLCDHEKWVGRHAPFQMAGTRSVTDTKVATAEAKKNLPPPPLPAEAVVFLAVRMAGFAETARLGLLRAECWCSSSSC